MGFGLGPGFLLPLVLAWRMAPVESDRIIALMTMSVIGSAVITVATESYAVAELARFSEHGYSYRDGTTAVHRQMLPKSALATLLIALIVGLAFLLSGSMDIGTALWLLVVAAGVFLTCIASSYAAVLILNEQSHTPLALQGLRHVMLILAAMIIPNAGIFLIMAYLFGEALRTIALGLITKRFVEQVDVNQPATHSGNFKANDDGLYRQFASNGVSQGNVLIERTAISTQQAGSLTLYDIADKVSFIFIQGAYSLEVLPKLGSWAKLAGGDTRAEAAASFNRDMRSLIIKMIAVLAPLALISGAISLFAPLSEQAARGAAFLAILLIAAIPTLQVMAQMRFIVMLGGARYLLPVTFVSLAIMLTFGLALFSLIGVIGILLGRLFYRLVSVAMFQRYITKLAKS